MRHPTEGTLRRLLDEPAGAADTDRDHVDGCDACVHALGDMGDDAALVRAALATDVDVDLDAAWLRLSAAASSTASESVVQLAAPRRRRGRRPAFAAVAVAVVVAGAGAAAANDWLPIFRTERVEPLSISIDDLNAMPDLTDYGTVEITGVPDVHTVTDREAAAAETGLDVPEVATLPNGVTGEPAYQVGDEVSAVFTFDADEAGDAPPGLDGSQVRFVAGPGVVQRWSSRAGVPALVVGRAVAPTADSTSGLPFETVRDHLLSLPGLPDDVAESLRAFNADGSTLPIPVPADRVTTSDVLVGDRPATLLTTPDRTLAAVVWVDDGVLTVVAGALGADEVMTVAQELR